jgi:short-subunit dehydrogenase
MNKSVAQWALVTGASSGLGVELARALAARGLNLVLVARREEPMQKLATELRRQHGAECIVEAIDLSEPDSAASLQRRLDQRNIDPDILINNAAFGLAGAFLDHTPERLREMLQLDVITMTELTHVFGKRMAARGRGHVLLVASMAAYGPTPILAAYGAAKAFVLSFGEALHAQLAPKVGVTVLSPGLIDTGFNEVSGYRPEETVRRTMLAPAKVAEIGLDAMFAGRSSVIAGRLNKIMAFSSRFISRQLQAKLVIRLSKG